MAEFKHIYTDKKRLSIFKEEKQKLNEVFAKIDEDKRSIVEGLIESASWQRVMLTELQEILKRDGYIETYQNGENQFGMKKSAASEVYDKTLNTYTKIVKQLCDLVADEGCSSPGSEIMSFISAR